MKINRERLSKNNGSAIFRYTLENDLGMTLQLLTLGASLLTLTLPFTDGTTKNVVLSYADWEMYRTNPLYLGATLAPNAGRISEANLPMNHHKYVLSRNEGRHNAHGGHCNASLQNWKEAATDCNADSCSVTLSILLPDGLDGFPGDRLIQTCYSLDNNNTVSIRYHAETSKETYLNLSNHTYFNLSGDFHRSGLDQSVEIYADRYVENNQEHIPASIQACADTPFDFRVFTSFSENISKYQYNSQLLNANGYNNAFILNKASDPISKSLCLRDASSGYNMELYTDAPSIVVYSGGYIGNHYRLADGFLSSNSCAIALEAQDIPDTPNFLPGQCRLTTPDAPYDRNIVFKFVAQTKKI
jgi:aldose 1-epimerase